MLPTFPTHRRALAVLASGAVAAGLAVAVTLGSTPGPRPGLVAGTPTGEQPSPTLSSRPRIAPAPPVSTAAPEVPAAGPAPAGEQSQPRTTSAPRSAPTTRARPPSRPTAIKPSPTRRAATAPRPNPKPAPRPPSATGGPTGWGALNGAISRIPGYRSSGITWTVTSRYGHYGTTDLATSDIYISPHVPVSLLDSVVRHEYAHVVTVRVYGGQWRVAKSALNAAFDGSGMTGAERAADCMARLMGASWTNYTSCSSSSWRRNAELLLEGRRI